MYRRERGALERLLAAGSPADQPAHAALQARSARLRPVLDELRALDRAGLLGRGLPYFAAQVAHMTVNRLLARGHRQTEPILYALLARLDAARSARR